MMGKWTTVASAGMMLAFVVILMPAGHAQIFTERDPFSVAVADLDGDGNADLVTGHKGGSVCWHFGNGSGGFGAANCINNAGTGMRFVTIVDINGDSNPDIVAADFGGSGVKILINNGGRSGFTAGGFYSTGDRSFPRSLAVADIDGDGNLDIVTANWGSGTVGFFKGNGDGTFASVQTTPGVGRVHGIAVADFNGDGNLDVAVADFGSGSSPPSYDTQVYVLLGNGDGSFQAPIPNTVGAGPRFIAATDFNADGCPDLASANQQGNNVSILMNNCDGTGTFAAAVNIPITGQLPFGLASGDTNGDGIDDLVVSTNTGATLVSLVNNTDGTFADPVSRPTGGTKSRFVALADVNNDGILDALVVNNGSGTISVFIGNGDGTFGS